MRHLLTTAAIAAVMVASGPSYAADQQDMKDAAKVGANTAGVVCNREFGTVDVNGDGKISDQEAVTASKNEFDRIDVDSNGSLSTSEWDNCNQSAMMNGGTSDHMDNTGKKSGDQSASAGSTTDKSSGSTTDTTSADSSNQMADTDPQSAPFAGRDPFDTDQEFQAADTDKNNEVTRDEAAKAAENEYTQQGNGLDKEDFARMYGSRFNTIDQNSDGKISQDEWKNRDTARIQSAFDQLDKDSNGRVSLNEYQQARKSQSSDNGQPVTVWYYFIY